MSSGFLFPIDDWPDGFRYQDDMLSESEERELVAAFAKEDFDFFQYHQYTAKRRVVSYGWDYDFDMQKASATAAIPEFLLDLKQRCATFAGMDPQELVQATIHEYPRGAPIGWHRDAPQFGTVVGVSLASSCRMRLRPYKREGRTVTVTLQPRSMYVISGEARWGYQHSIPAVDALRYSVTFRTLRKGAITRSDPSENEAA